MGEHAPEPSRASKDEAVRRAREGIKKPVLYKGKPARIDGEIVMEHQSAARLRIASASVSGR